MLAMFTYMTNCLQSDQIIQSYRLAGSSTNVAELWLLPSVVAAMLWSGGYYSSEGCHSV